MPRPEEVPVATEEQRRETERVLLKWAKLKESPLKGVGGECVVCGEKMEYREDLTFEYHAGPKHVVITNLTGARCTKCGDEAYDARSSVLIDRYTREEVAGGHEAKITVVGSGKLGIYFPLDVLREMNLMPKKRAIIKPLTRHKMLVEVEE